MSETNKFYQYDRNDNNTFGVRGAASGGGTTVVANETLAGTEDSLTELTVGETKYKVDQPINVVANPTLAGTESALTGLQVGDTKYAVQSGVAILNTYTVKTYTPSDTDYLQLLDDLDKRRDIQIQNRIASLVKHEYADTWIYSSAGNTYDTYNTQINCYTFYKSGDNITVTSKAVSLLTVESSNTSGDLYKGLRVGPNIINFMAKAVDPITTAPTAANTDGLKFVVLTSEPATYYDGYYYIIAPST